MFLHCSQICLLFAQTPARPVHTLVLWTKESVMNGLLGYRKPECKPLSPQLQGLRDALLRNRLEEDGGENLVILTNRGNTSFAGTSFELPEDLQLITAIQSIPCHY